SSCSSSSASPESARRFSSNSLLVRSVRLSRCGHAAQQRAHFRDDLRMGRVFGEVGDLAGIALVIVQLRARLSGLPFAVTIAFIARGASAVAQGGEGGLLPRLLRTRQQRREALALSLRHGRELAEL